MKYKNRKDKKISRKESEIRRLKALDFWRKDLTIEKVEPFQYGWDTYFDVDPIYKGTVFEEQVWEVLPIIMNVGWIGEVIPHIPRNKDNKLGYYYNGGYYSRLEEPGLVYIDEEIYSSLKISHDLFRVEGDLYTDGNGDIKSFKKYYFKFLDRLVIRKNPCIVDEIRVLDELVLQEESETEDRIRSLEGYKKWYSDTFSTKGWRKFDRRKKRQKDKKVCKNSLLENFDDGIGDGFNFSDNRKDMWWWLY